MARSTPNSRVRSIMLVPSAVINPSPPATAGPTGRAFVAQLHKLLTAHMRAHLKAAARRHKLTLPAEVVAHYLVSSLVAMLTWWLDQDMPYTPERMSAMFRQLAEPGALRAIGVV